MERKTTAFKKQLFLAMLVLGIHATFAQTVLYVDQSASGANNGTNWANAYTELQNAIDAAATTATSASPVQVWVAAGTYYPTTGTDRTISFEMKNDVQIYGGFDGSELALAQRDYKNNQTILSGDIGTPGIVTDNSQNIISNSNFTTSPLTSSAILDGFTIRDGFMDDGSLNGGAGIRNNNSSPTIRYCTFINNKAEVITHPLGGGGAILNAGESNPTIIGCTFKDNYSAMRGGAIAFASPSSSFSHTIESKVINCVFYQNLSVLGGGAVWIYRYKVNIANSTFVDNSLTQSNSQGGAIVMYNNDNGELSTLANNIFWDNTASQGSQIYFFEQFPTTDPLYGPNLVDGGISGIVGGLDNIGTIISDDPQFTDQASGDLSIKHCSPAVDVGDNSAISESLDLDGNSRVFNTNVDLGAYENLITPLFFSAAEVGDVVCNGETNGQISANGGGGTGSVEYSINGVNFVSTGLFEDLSAGNYTLTIRDTGNGCTYSEVFTINEPAVPTISNVVRSNVSCNGANNGQVSGTASGNTGPYIVRLENTSSGDLISSPQFTSSFLVTNVPPANYNILIEDANNCSYYTLQQISVSEPTVLSASASVSNILCAGDNNGEIEITTSGGTTPYSYSLDGTNFQSANIFSGLAPNSYTITVKDSKDCTVTLNETITQPSALSVLAVTGIPVSCNGGSDGVFSFAGQGGTSPYEYSLDGVNFKSTPLWENQPAGNYTITIRDANGCLITTTWTVTEPSALSGSVTATGTSSCGLSDGQLDATISGGTTPYLYSLDGGTTTQSSGTFSGLSAGAYTVTVIDDNGCELAFNETINDPVTATVSTAKVDVTCNGATTGSITVNVTGGTSPITYALNGGTPQSGNVFNGLDAGTYSIEVVENNGCTQSVSVTIDEPSAIAAATSVNDVSCNGEFDGRISISASGGTGVLMYSLDGPNGNLQTTPVFTNLSAGSYDVTVVDENQCTTVVSTTISEPAVLTINTTSTNAQCEGGALGTFDISISGGTGPYTFTYGNSAPITSGSASGTIRAGTYEIVATDANGCQASETLVIENDVTIVPSEVSVTSRSCSNVSDGAVEITATGGTAPYSFAKDGVNFQSSGVFTGMGSSYFITVMDANGCMATIGGSIPTPDPISIQTDVTNLSCFEENNGFLSITATGGTSPYEYSLDGTNFQTSSSFTGLAAGEYEITVLDANGCQRLSSALIEEPDQLSISVVQNDRSFTLSATGGTEPYEYSSDGSTFQSTSAFTNLIGGNYTFTVKDANGCESTSEVFEVVLGVINPEVTIYPNPVSDFLKIKGIDFDHASIIDLNGKEVLRSRSGIISIGELADGIHIIRLFKRDRVVHEQKIKIN